MSLAFEGEQAVVIDNRQELDEIEQAQYDPLSGDVLSSKELTDASSTTGSAWLSKTAFLSLVAAAI